jgi:hypothetical protein
MAKRGLFWTIGIAGLGYVGCLAVGEAATPGSAQTNVNAAATAGMAAENGSGALVTNGIDNFVAPVMVSAKNAAAQSGLGDMFSTPAPSGANDPTAVPADTQTTAP